MRATSLALVALLGGIAPGCASAPQPGRVAATDSGAAEVPDRNLDDAVPTTVRRWSPPPISDEEVRKRDEAVQNARARSFHLSGTAAAEGMRQVHDAEAARTAGDAEQQCEHLARAIVVATGFNDDPSFITADFMQARGWQMLADFLESQDEWSLALQYWQRWSPTADGCGTYGALAARQRAEGIERCTKRTGR